SLLYSGGALAYARRSDIYWDPRRYQSHTLGVEWAWRAADAVAGRLRVQRGIGWTSEVLGIAADSVVGHRSRQAPQVGLGGDVTWRGSWWNAGAELRWSRGRTGGYQALHGGLVVRIDWPPAAGTPDGRARSDGVAAGRRR
ncbi:MAG TPA: hypothetical protein VMM18_12040, partial [Gemmatimonadaceae bacterium]|nr:hypothetical protein [Gemmatimonadaceae bacterium]